MQPRTNTAALELRPLKRATTSAVTVQALDSGQEAEVLHFLAERPVHTVYMTGLIRDNGLISPLNRGTFYGCRNTAGELEGVALIGHATLIDTNSEAALAAFARVTQQYAGANMIMGEQEKMERFWEYYSESGQVPRLACRELLLEQRWPIQVQEAVPALRIATIDDLDLIVPVHAQMAFEESGVNPLDVNPEGFRQRCARRIEQGRVWIWAEAGRLLFKADIVADTPEMVYLEGIYVNPDERGKGYGLRCMAQIGQSLLKRAGGVCLLVNERNLKAHALYRKAGFRLRGYYDTIFLQR